MKNFLFVVFLLATSAGHVSAFPTYVFHPGSQCRNKDQNGRNYFNYASFRVAILPNEPIFDGIKKSATIDSINAHPVAFTIFNGDSKNGHSMCTDTAIGQNIVDYFNMLQVPTLYAPGDNEWTDCHRISNGEYNPNERLDFLHQVFFDKETTQGPHPIPVSRQGELGEQYSENSRFHKNHVMFVALNVVGSNNGFVTTDKQCFKKSNRTWVECNAATSEYFERNKKTTQWLKSSFQEAKDNNSVGIAIVIHADMYFSFEMSDGGYQDDFLPHLDTNNGFTDFFHALATETKNFKGQVVLIHGDSHYFKVDKGMFNDDGSITNNFTRIETFGDIEQSWVEMTIDPKSKEVFSFKPILLKALSTP